MQDPPSYPLPISWMRRRTAAGILFAALLIAGPGASFEAEIPELRQQQAQVPPGLEPLIRLYPDQTDRTLKSMKRGIEHYLAGRHAQAFEALSEAETGNSTKVGDYMILYRAKAALMLEKGEEALDAFRRLQARFPNSSQFQESLLGECQAQLKLRQPASALAILKNPRLEESAESLYLRGRALEDSGKREEAAAVYLRITAKYASSKSVPAAEQRLAALSPGYWKKPANYASQLERAENLIRSGKNRDARTLLARIALVRPAASENSWKRKLLFAQAEYNLGRGSTVLPLLNGFPESLTALRPQVLYLQAACYRRLNREDSFLAVRDKALSLFPRSPFTEKILFSAAGYFDVKNRVEECRKAYEDLLAGFPKGEYAERAMLRSAFMAFFQRQHEAGLNGFSKYFEAFGTARTAPALLYWLGRSYEGLGDGARAAALYLRCSSLNDDNYYGQRAALAEQELRRSGKIPGKPYAGADFERLLRRAEEVRPLEPAFSPASGAAAAIVERVHQLTTAGLPDLALSELRWATRQLPEERGLKYLMSRLYDAKEDYFSVISTLRRTFPDYDARPRSSLPREVWELLFPTVHMEVIADYSAKYSLDPNLVLGLIRQESAFSEQANSSAKARGLMQVLPSTGRQLAREARIPKYTARKLLQADVNIALGTRYFAELLDRFDHRTEFALAAYNAGSERVDRWRREFGEIEMTEFVERIPFSETRDYVKQVLTNAALYRRLNATPDSASN